MRNTKYLLIIQNKHKSFTYRHSLASHTQISKMSVHSIKQQKSSEQDNVNRTHDANIKIKGQPTAIKRTETTAERTEFRTFQH